MVYVTLARGQLLGSSVLITRTHFPQVFEVVERCASLLHVPMPLIFVRDDMFVPIVALGFGEPYSLVISSHWLDHFQEDELTFMIGRELGHVAAGHTRLTSLLSVNGRENALVSIIFGAWLRRTEYTADRLGCFAAVQSMPLATSDRRRDTSSIRAQHRPRNLFSPKRRYDPAIRFCVSASGLPRNRTQRIESRSCASFLPRSSTVIGKSACSATERRMPLLARRHAPAPCRARIAPALGAASRRSRSISSSSPRSRKRFRRSSPQVRSNDSHVTVKMTPQEMHNVESLRSNAR